MDKKQLFEFIDAKEQVFYDTADFVFDHPETCFQEYESSGYQMKVMEAQGFQIINPLGEMETAFAAVWGEGKPVIGILGENDALPNQSQVPDYVGAKSIEEGANGHACAHNLLGSGSMQAAVALKDYMEANGLKGTIKYVLCPAEEGGGGKVFLARSGAFEDLDCALTWHPSDDSTPDQTGLACVSFDLTFEGKAAHAAGEPWNGRSALDAIELLNIGVQFLREHVTPDTRIHYGYVDAGGSAPNVVQRHAKIRYCVRAANADYMESVYHRVIDVARGAALMTGTTFQEPYIYSAYKDFLWNDTLDKLMMSHLEEQFPIEYTEEELAYAAQFVPYGRFPEAKDPINKEIWYDFRKPARGSTDVADVSYCCPTTSFRVVAAPNGAIGHGWTTTVVGKSSLAHKGMRTAAAMIAMTAIDLIEKPELLEQAKADFEKMGGGKPYHTMVPDSLKPGDHQAQISQMSRALRRKSLCS